jgi:hypothetical protein
MNILGQLPATFNVKGMGSFNCTIANEGVNHQIAVKVNAVDEDVQVQNARPPKKTNPCNSLSYTDFYI